MVKKAVLFCLTLILIGTIDWITTIIGIVCFGATETNPLLGLTQSNLFIFSLIKLSAVILAGLAFYKAETKTKINTKTSPLTKNLVTSGFAISAFTLSAVVANNITTIVRLT
jgi:hypothetical protein